MTDAELLIWQKIRRGQIDGFQFRKQVPIGAYVADFACLAQKLVIEIDGGQHDERKAQDDERTVWLGTQGYRVLRFWNNDVLGNVGGVLETIQRALKRLK